MKGDFLNKLKKKKTTQKYPLKASFSKTEFQNMHIQKPNTRELRWLAGIQQQSFRKGKTL